MTIVGIRRLATPLGALVVAGVVASVAATSCDSGGDDAAGGAASTPSSTIVDQASDTPTNPGAISQRVANETAQVLQEIGARY